MSNCVACDMFMRNPSNHKCDPKRVAHKDATMKMEREENYRGTYDDRLSDGFDMMEPGYGNWDNRYFS